MTFSDLSTFVLVVQVMKQAGVPAEYNWCVFWEKEEKGEQATGPESPALWDKNHQAAAGTRKKDQTLKNGKNLGAAPLSFLPRSSAGRQNIPSSGRLLWDDCLSIFFPPSSIFSVHERCWLDAARTNCPMAEIEKRTERWKQISQWSERLDAALPWLVVMNLLFTKAKRWRPSLQIRKSNYLHPLHLLFEKKPHCDVTKGQSSGQPDVGQG